MKNLFIIAKEDFVNLVKNPMWIFFGTGFPLILIAIIGTLTKRMYGTEVTSFDYYGITLMLYTMLSGGMTSANAFMEERIKKPNMRIIYAPGSVKNIFLSKILASFAFLFILDIFDIIFITLVFNVTINNMFFVMILFALTELFAVTLGIMICCIVKAESLCNQIQSIVINILSILGGVLFSLDGYGKFVRNISFLSPVKWIVKALFQIIYDNNLSLFAPAVIILVICIGLMMLVCGKTFRKEDCIC